MTAVEIGWALGGGWNLVTVTWLLFYFDTKLIARIAWWGRCWHGVGILPIRGWSAYVGCVDATHMLLE